MYRITDLSISGSSIEVLHIFILRISEFFCKLTNSKFLELDFCRSEEWNLISDAEKQDMGLVWSHDGEFW